MLRGAEGACAQQAIILKDSSRQELQAGVWRCTISCTPRPNVRTGYCWMIRIFLSVVVLFGFLADLSLAGGKSKKKGKGKNDKQKQDKEVDEFEEFALAEKSKAAALEPEKAPSEPKPTAPPEPSMPLHEAMLKGKVKILPYVMHPSRLPAAIHATQAASGASTSATTTTTSTTSTTATTTTTATSTSTTNTSVHASVSYPSYIKTDAESMWEVDASKLGPANFPLLVDSDGIPLEATSSEQIDSHFAVRMYTVNVAGGAEPPMITADINRTRSHYQKLAAKGSLRKDVQEAIGKYSEQMQMAIENHVLGACLGEIILESGRVDMFGECVKKNSFRIAEAIFVRRGRKFTDELRKLFELAKQASDLRELVKAGVVADARRTRYITTLGLLYAAKADEEKTKQRLELVSSESLEKLSTVSANTHVLINLKQGIMSPSDPPCATTSKSPEKVDTDCSAESEDGSEEKTKSLSDREVLERHLEKLLAMGNAFNLEQATAFLKLVESYTQEQRPSFLHLIDSESIEKFLLDNNDRIIKFVETVKTAGRGKANRSKKVKEARELATRTGQALHSYQQGWSEILHHPISAEYRSHSDDDDGDHY